MPQPLHIRFLALLLTIGFVGRMPSSIVAAADTIADPAKSAAALAALRAELASGKGSPAAIPPSTPAQVPLTKSDAAAARKLLWEAHAARIRKDRAAEIREGLLKDGKLAMRLFLRPFGTPSPAGRSLWLSLHGGGGAPKPVNDQQWENQKRLYRLAEGLYVAPRAPTDNWNLWHEPHIDRLFARLIEDLIVLENVDPDRVYVMGYSAGGDGVYQLAPRMADRWAAAAMMAGHPNDASPLGLRNVAFALQVGALDAAFNRNQVAKEWAARLDQLQHDDPHGYVHFVKLHAGKAHWMDGQDARVLPWMAERRRDPTPDRVVWKQSGVVHDRLYWLAVPPKEAKPGALVVAARAGQTVTITDAEQVKNLLVRLDDRMLDLDKPVTIACRGRTLFRGVVPRTAATMAQTLAGCGDPRLMFDAEVRVELPSPGDRP